MPVVQNNQKSAIVVSDLNLAWMPMGQPMSILSLTERQFRSSGHLQSLLLTGELSVVSAEEAGQALAKERQERRQATSDKDVILESTVDKEMVSYQCFGNKNNGERCKLKVMIVNDGIDRPLCANHQDQTNACRWDAHSEQWLLADLKAEDKLEELPLSEMKEVHKSIPGYQEELPAETSEDLNPASYLDDRARESRQKSLQ